ncbi:hypothetical protein ABZT49_03225 [Methylobacterium sp. EM32]|uniref:hypothetical protein n=1 Tax=Methylobacterium sp. EM32 TaxID=3163481 RepID=UPI0033AEADD9
MRASKKPSGNMVDVVSLQQKFEPIRLHAHTAADLGKIAQDELNAVLGKIYEFGLELRKDTAIAEAFIVANGEKYSLPAKGNIFIPLVKIAFRGSSADKATFSQRSTALDIATREKPKSEPAKDWFDRHGGYAGVYKKFDKQAISANSGSTNAFSFSGLAKPLLELERAVRLLRDLTLPVIIKLPGEDKARPTRAFVIGNVEGDRCRVEVVGHERGYSFPCGHVMLGAPIHGLGDGIFVLTDQEAERFAHAFAKEDTGWQTAATADVATFTSPSGVTINAVAFSRYPDGQYLVCATEQLRNRSSTLTLTHQAMDAFINGVQTNPPSSNVFGWHDTVKIAHAKQSKLLEINWTLAQRRRTYLSGGPDVPLKATNPVIPLPDKLNLTSDYTGVSVGFHEEDLPFCAAASNLVSHLFSASTLIPIRDERWLDLDDANRLCRALLPLKVDAEAKFVDVDQPQGALCVVAAFDNDELLLVLPLVHTPGGDRVGVCEPFAAWPTQPQPAIAPSTSPPALLPASSSVAPGSVSASAPLSIITSSLPVSTSSLVKQQFGAFITSFRSPDETVWKARRDIFRQQLEWWIEHTDIPLHLRLSGWTDAEVEAFDKDTAGLLSKFVALDGSYSVAPGSPLIINRIACLEQFYRSSYDWGIMMDDDAILETKYDEGRGLNFFAEMAINRPLKYDEVDIFFPYWDKKPPRHPRAFWNQADYDRNHIFHKDADLKGSMFVMRNFRKEGKVEIFPDKTYTIHGEDTLLATEAIARGYTVRKCANICLFEFKGPSYFEADRVKNMREAHVRIAKMYEQYGLRMLKPDDPSRKTLYRKEFFKRCWKGPDDKIVAKP